jgi:hypothetical protein
LVTATDYRRDRLMQIADNAAGFGEVTSGLTVENCISDPLCRVLWIRMDTERMWGHCRVQFCESCAIT